MRFARWRPFRFAAGAVAVLLTAGVVVAAPSKGATLTPYPGGTWQPDPAIYGVVADKNVPVRMSDGVDLVADVYYPSDPETGLRAPGRFPVLLTQNPYTDDPPLSASEATGELGSSGPGDYFVTRGYIFVSVDVRGTGRSGGMAGFFSPRDAQDGVEMALWSSRLPGSDGIVGLQGCSYLGQTQLYTAALLGPNSPVKAMIPMCVGGDVYRDAYFDDGIASPAWTGAGCCSGALLGPSTEAFMLQQYANSATGGDNAYDKTFWLERDHVSQAAAIVGAGVPALLWNGWEDNGFGGLELYAALQNAYFGRNPLAPLLPGEAVTGRYQVILGDWTHGGGIDPAIELEWYDTWLKQQNTGMAVGTPTPLHVWENQRGWVNAASYPLTDSYTRLFFGPRGTLASAAPRQPGADTVSWGPPSMSGSTSTYTSAAFPAGATLGGPAAVSLVASSDNSNLEMMADLYDVAPDGSATQITHGALLGSLRALNANRSWTDSHGLPMRPFLSLLSDVPVPAGEAVSYEIPLQPTVWSLAPGHRLRLELSTQADPQVCLQKAAAIVTSAVGCFPRATELAALAGGMYAIDFGGTHLSSISLPLLAYHVLHSTRSGTTPTSQGVSLPLDW